MYQYIMEIIIIRYKKKQDIFEVITGLFGGVQGLTNKPNVSAAPLAAVFSGIRVYLTRDVKRQTFTTVLMA